MTEIHLNVCHCLGYTQNMRRSLSTMLGVGYQICGGVCQQRLVFVIKSVTEFANNAWCWLSNLWRSLPTTLGVGYQICGGACQQRLVLVIKSPSLHCQTHSFYSANRIGGVMVSMLVSSALLDHWFDLV